MQSSAVTRGPQIENGRLVEWLLIREPLIGNLRLR